MRKIVSLFLCVLMLCALCVPAYAEDGSRDGRIGWISLIDQPDKTFIVRKSCEVSKLDVQFATLIIDKGVTVTVDDWTDICAAQIILLGTLDISKCWEIDEYKADIIVLDSGKFITNEEVDESVVTHSEHYYINNKCVDCGEDEPFTEVEPDEIRMINLFDQPDKTFIVRKSCELSKLDVMSATLIIDKGVTVTVDDWANIGPAQIILLGTLDISKCWEVEDHMANIIVLDSGKFITNDEVDESVVTHSEHYYINNKCIDCGEDEPFTEVEPDNAEDGWKGRIYLDQPDKTFIIRKSCDLLHLMVDRTTLIIDKGVTVTVDGYTHFGIGTQGTHIILLGTLDISNCYSISDEMSDIVVMDSGKLITKDEHDDSVVTHSKHYYINNKCVDCGEDEPFIEVDPYKDEPPLTGSAFSEYSLPVIVGMSSAVVFGVGGFFLGRKKKKNAE